MYLLTESLGHLCLVEVYDYCVHGALVSEFPEIVSAFEGSEGRQQVLGLPEESFQELGIHFGSISNEYNIWVFEGDSPFLENTHVATAWLPSLLP